jgi:hypothetical protein
MAIQKYGKEYGYILIVRITPAIAGCKKQSEATLFAVRVDDICYAIFALHSLMSSRFSSSAMIANVDRAFGEGIFVVWCTRCLNRSRAALAC